MKNGQVSKLKFDGQDIDDIPCDKMTHYYYNADGTLGSVDYHEVAYTQTGGAPEVDDVYFAYGY